MNKKYILILLYFITMFIAPLASAQFAGGGFESKISSLSNALISQVLPLLSVLGIAYASALAMNGSPEAKNKIMVVIGCSVVGFLAPYLIQWLKNYAS